jgi:RecA/RadA recombinase
MAVRAASRKRPNKSRSNKVSRKPSSNLIEVRRQLYINVLDEVEQQFDLGGSDPARRLSTGSLVQDLIIGGGLVSGMTTLFGPEASAKSTAELNILYSGVQAKIPIIAHFDAEGTATSDPNYAGAIYRVRNLEQIYGKRVDDKWIIPPKVRYYDGTILEPTYGAMLYILNRIPDKFYRPERNGWFLRIKNNDKRIARFLKAGDIDSRLSDKQYTWISTDDDRPQALFGVDSYPVLLPESIDEREEDDSSEAMATQALAYAKVLRKIVGRFKRKQCIVAGVNQLRDRPGVMYGSPIYEPCGNALKLYSSVRNQFSSRYAPKNWRAKGQSQYSIEPSVEGRGEDHYAYKFIKNAKNKTAPPWKEGWVRVWIKDTHGVGRGFDVVFDTAYFLEMLGLAKIQGNFQSIKFNRRMDHELAGKQLRWLDFKAQIIGEEYPNSKLVVDVRKPLKLRAWCSKLLRDGKSAELLQTYETELIERRRTKRNGKGGDDDMESDD